MKNNYSQEIKILEKKLDKLSKRSKIRGASCRKAPLSNDEIYNRMISSSFERISRSKESAVRFLKECKILDKDGHLTPEYR